MLFVALFALFFLANATQGPVHFTTPFVNPETDVDVVTDYGYAEVNKHSTDHVLATSNSAVHYLYDDETTLSLVVIFDKAKDGSGGSTEFTVDLSQVDAPEILLEDDPVSSSKDSLSLGDDKKLSGKFQWHSCCTDGFIVQLQKEDRSDFCLEIEYTSTEGIDQLLVLQEGGKTSEVLKEFIMCYTAPTEPRKQGITVQKHYSYNKGKKWSTKVGFTKKDTALHYFYEDLKNDILSLVVIYDKVKDGSGGKTELRIDMGALNGNEDVKVVVNDDGREKNTWHVTNGFSIRHRWHPCCTDGFALQLQKADPASRESFCLTLKYDLAEGLTSFKKNDGQQGWVDVDKDEFRMCYNPPFDAASDDDDDDSAPEDDDSAPEDDDSSSDSSPY